MTSTFPDRGRSPHWCIALATAAAFSSAGCFGNETTPFPDGLEPLEEVTVDPPPMVDGTYPEELALITGATDRYDWVQARGYVNRPLFDVLAAFETPEVCVDRRAVDSFTITEDVEEGYDRSFRVRNVVEDIVTVEFDITWRHGIVEGDQTNPTVTASRWQKTWGSVFISLLRGSAVARSVEAGVTEIEFVMHLDGASGGVDPAVGFVTDLHASVVAASHGDPLPTY